MNCPQCLTRNAAGRKFCRECGRELFPVCRGCGQENAPGDRYCGACGDAVQGTQVSEREIPYGEKLARLQRYLPEGLTGRILAQKGKLEGELRQVTVLFCDLAGFSTLAAEIGQEEAFALMDSVYEVLIHKVNEHEGTVNEMTGDGVLALFGAPVALEDAPLRALHTAAAIHGEMALLSKGEMARKGLRPLLMRIGIHTGPAVVGTLGNNLRVEFKAVGETVNLASRMETLAEPGTTCVTEATFRLAQNFFRFEDLGERKVKGKKEPVRVYRALGPAARRCQAAPRPKELTAFVGRERELRILLHGLDRLQEERGEAFCIVGEAGVGKTRLLREFREAAVKKGMIIWEGRCAAHCRGAAYHLVREVLHSALEINEEEGERGVREKIRRGLRAIHLEEPAVRRCLLELFSPGGAGERFRLSPDGRRNFIAEALKRIIRQTAKIQPLLLALEDLQRIDGRSEEVLQEVMEIVPRTKLLLVLTYRADYRPSWKSVFYPHPVVLNRLTRQETLAMVNHILGPGSLVPHLEKLILRKSGGVPLYVEEFLRSLRELNLIAEEKGRFRLARDGRSLALPANLQEMITARVDRLPPGAKEVLQVAAVMGGEGSCDLLRRVMGLEEGVFFSRISLLRSSDLLQEKGRPGQAAYFFNHVLTRDAVYHSLLARKRKELHARIARAMQGMSRGNPGGPYGRLAEHFMASDHFMLGAHYARLAAREARARSDYQDAIPYTEQEIFCLERLPPSEEVQRRLIDARTSLAGAWMSLNFHVEAREAVLPILEPAQHLNDRKALPGIYSALGSYLLFVLEDHPGALANLKEALKIAGEEKDSLALWNASYLLGMALSWNCEFDEAARCFARSLELSMAAGNPIGICAAKINLGMNHLFAGRIDRCREIARESMKIAAESQDIYIQGMVHAFYGTACYYHGSLAAAEDHLCEGAALSEKTTHFTWGSWASAFLGDMYFEMGKYEKSLAAYGRASSFLEKGQFGPSWLNLIRVALARSGVLAGKRSDLPMSEVEDYSRRNRKRSLSGWIAQYLAEALLHLHQLPEARERAEKAIALDEEKGMMLLLGKDLALYGRILERQGEKGKAREALGRAMEIFTGCGAQGEREKIKQILNPKL